MGVGNVRKKIILTIIAVAIILAVLVFIVPAILYKMRGTRIITSSQLENAIHINQLSTAEFVYNGIAQKRSGDNPEKVECYISYNANVKVGISLEDVEFQIDKETKTVMPVLPPIEITIADLDEKSIGYIPKNPDIDLKEVISICKEDAISEANQSQSLYEIAEENLKSVIEALLSPILDNAGYSLVWETGGV